MAKLRTRTGKRRPRREKPKKSIIALIIKTVVAVALIVTIAGISYYQFTEYTYRTEYNSAVETYARGDMDEATKMFEVLYEEHKTNPKRIPPIKKKLIACYRHYASDVGISLKLQAKYLKKIKIIDANSLTAKDKTLLEASAPLRK